LHKQPTRQSYSTFHARSSMEFTGVHELGNDEHNSTRSD
jgi:hypothetical protein